MKIFKNEDTEEYLDNEQMKELDVKLVEKISFKNYTGIEFANIDLDSNHPENAFDDVKYYKAMKDIPLKQKKALYLLAVEGLSIKRVAKLLDVTQNEVLELKDIAIKKFKENYKKGEN